MYSLEWNAVFNITWRSRIIHSTEPGPGPCREHNNTMENSLRDVIFATAQAAALGPRREAPCLVPNSSSRPADVLLPSWSQGRSAALDVSVISPLQKLTLNGAATIPGHVGANRKLAAGLPACGAAGVEFLPLMVETLGGWSSEAITNLKKIARSLGSRCGPASPAETVKHFFGRVVSVFCSSGAVSGIRGKQMTPAVASEQSIFSKNHDCNSYNL